MPRAKRGEGGCKIHYHKATRMRRVCVVDANKPKKVCKHGTRTAYGRCPRGKRTPDMAGMAALRAKYPKAFKGAAATKIGKVARGFLGRVQARTARAQRRLRVATA